MVDPSRLPRALYAGVLICAALPLRAEISDPAASRLMSAADFFRTDAQAAPVLAPLSLQGAQLAQNQGPHNLSAARPPIAVAVAPSITGAAASDTAADNTIAQAPGATQVASSEDTSSEAASLEPDVSEAAVGEAGSAESPPATAPAAATSSSETRLMYKRRAADPFEGFNRAMFSFNRGLDRTVLKPVATAYVAVIPGPVRSCVANFFGNLSDIWTTVNDVLQAKGRAAINDGGRVLMNTTFGVLGCFDLASRAGVEKRKEDFGQTLGHWGVGEGPYLVLPVLGPSTVRDTVALPADSYGDLVQQVDHVRTYNQLSVLRIVDLRSQLLDATDMVDAAALDAYSFTRDAFLQRRRSLVDDGERDNTDLPDYGGNLSQAAEADAGETGGVSGVITPADPGTAMPAPADAAGAAP